MSDTQLLAVAQTAINHQLDQIKDLKRRLAIANRALIKIRDEDYRVNRHSSHFTALWALKEIE